MDYTRDGKIKHISSDDITYSGNCYDGTGNFIGTKQEINKTALIDIINSLIDEINESRDVK